MLTITEPEDSEDNKSKGEDDRKKLKKRVVMIMARQHPGESPGSFVVQGKVYGNCYHNICFSLGLIDFLVSKHTIAKELREKLIFKVR